MWFRSWFDSSISTASAPPGVAAPPGGWSWKSSKTANSWRGTSASPWRSVRLPSTETATSLRTAPTYTLVENLAEPWTSTLAPESRP